MDSGSEILRNSAGAVTRIRVKVALGSDAVPEIPLAKDPLKSQKGRLFLGRKHNRNTRAKAGRRKEANFDSEHLSNRPGDIEHQPKQ